jgi:hypothetical protein
MQKSGEGQEINSLNLYTGTEAPGIAAKKNKDDRQRVLLKSPAARRRFEYGENIAVKLLLNCRGVKRMFGKNCARF